MTPEIRPLVAGNWKMNGVRASLDQIKAMAEGVKGPLSAKVEALICPPATSSMSRPRSAPIARWRSARRIATRKYPAPIPAISRPR